LQSGEGIRGGSGGGPRIETSLADMSFAGGGGGGGGSDSKDFIDLKHRFELLYRQFVDLSENAEKLVSRSEIEKAMQAVLLEVKKVKVASLDKKAIEKIIEKKADKEEFEKMIDALSGSLDGLREYVESANGSNSKSAAALRSKCLVCDKTIDPLAALAELEETARIILASKIKRPKQLKPVGTSVGYSKTEDIAARRPNTTNSYLESKTPNSMDNFKITNNSNPVQISTSSSINILPDINISMEPPLSSPKRHQVIDLRASSPNNLIDTQNAEGLSGSTTYKGQKSITMSPDAVKQRIRASAGGGLAPKYTTDNTR